MAEKSVIAKVKRYLQFLHDQNLPVSAAFIFGSQAKGTAHKDSDIDVAVISPIFDVDRLARAGVLWKAAWEIDTRIEPIPIGEKAFQTDYISPIYAIIREEGIRIK